VGERERREKKRREEEREEEEEERIDQTLELFFFADDLDLKTSQPLQNLNPKPSSPLPSHRSTRTTRSLCSSSARKR
jgi:hypothetical protein